MFSEYIGVVQRTHGLNGTVLLTDTIFQQLNLPPGTEVGIGYSSQHLKRVVIAECSVTPQRTTLRFAGCSSAEAAEVFIDQAVYISPENLGTQPDERYTIRDIEGCSVESELGEVYGRVREVWLMPANDVWEVEAPDGSLFPLPVIESVVKRIDVANKRITVVLMEGLRELGNTTQGNSDE